MVVKYTDYINFTLEEIMARINSEYQQNSAKTIISIETINSTGSCYKIRVWWSQQ